MIVNPGKLLDFGELLQQIASEKEAKVPYAAIKYC